MEGLGIDWKILLGQVINFLVLLWLLKRFVYKPFLNVLQKRQSQIEQGIKKSREAEESLARIRALTQEVKAASEKKAKELILEAEKKAQEKTKAVMTAAEEEKKRLVESTRAAMEKELVASRDQRQKETVDLALAVSGKFLGQKMDKEQDKKIIEKLVSSI